MVQHHGTIEILTQRLTLLPFRVEDAAAMYANWASDPEVTKYLTWPTHTSIDVSKWVCSNWVSRYSSDDYYQWAIWLDEISEPIGSIAVVKQDDKVAKAEIGYCIGRAWWHKGIVAEALEAVMDYLFDNEGYQRIEARHDPRNPHSGAVMRKCGMKYEGTLRQSDWNNQGICDAAWYSLLRSER